MRNILVEIHCPSCFYHTHIKSHTFVQPALAPQLRQRIMDHHMFTYQCPRCHEEITFIHNFLYHDVDHYFMIYMSSESCDLTQLQAQFPSFIIRLVSGPKQLRETIRILEDGLNDEVMSLMKQRLLEKDQALKELCYYDRDFASSTIWLEFIYEDARILKAVTQSSYDHLEQNIIRRQGSL